MTPQWSRFLVRFLQNRSGGMAVIAGLALPAVITLAVGAIDLVSVSADRGKIQDVLDQAAIQAAQQLGVTEPATLSERTRAYLDIQLAELKSRCDYTVTTIIAPDGKSVRVVLEGRRMSFFGSLLPPGGWPLRLAAGASPMGQVPLCVLSIGQDSGDRLQMGGTSQLTAAKCLVDSNSDIQVGSTAWLQAAMVQSAGTATGRITPAPQPSAPVIDDPFSSMALTAPTGACIETDVVYTEGTTTLPAGLHCGNITVKGTARLNLAPGEHYFKSGQLQLNQTGAMSGDDVFLLFDSTADFQFTGSASVTLAGRRSGAFAGFVIATARGNTRTLGLASDAARSIVGVIYAPDATLSVQGTNKIADQSAWTVIVAKAIKTNGGPNLVINSDYANSSVPVPGGVGPTMKNARLAN